MRSQRQDREDRGLSGDKNVEKMPKRRGDVKLRTKKRPQASDLKYTKCGLPLYVVAVSNFMCRSRWSCRVVNGLFSFHSKL